MITITCSLDSFNLDDSIQDSQERKLDYARSITSFLKEHLIGAKLLINENITQSAAYVALEENLAEYVKNSIDAFQQHKITKDRHITIKVPIKHELNNMTTIIYTDNAGGFSEKFLNGKKSIDYYHDKLNGHCLTIFSEKKSSDAGYLGGCGIALSQTSRFLRRHSGSLTIENTPTGSKMRLTSPINPLNSPKPSFHRFIAHIDYQAIFAENDKLANQSSSEDLVLDPPIPIATTESSEHRPTKNKFGLTLLI